MFQSISAFFNSAVFGISALTLQGVLSCLPGLIMGDAPKKRVDPGLIQIFSAVFATILSMIIIICTSAYPTCSWKMTLLTCGSSFYTGMSNFLMLLMMSKAMQSGPNGIIWATIQSAFIFPFIVSVAFFGVALTPLRFIGIVSLMAALVIFGAAKENTENTGKWKMLAFTCLAMCAVQQNITALPSFFPESRGVPSIVRALFEASGIVITGVIFNLVKMSPERKQMIKDNLRNMTMWKYVAVIQNFHVIFAYVLFYPSLNAMAANGLGGMSYPLLTGSCIMSFSVAGIVFLKEKFTLLQAAGLTCCISGLILICTNAN